MNTHVRLVVVTGLSGSGKTAALKALEDIGYFCVDNLPAALLPKFVQLSVLSGEMVNKVGIGMDSRDKAFLESHRQVFEEVEGLGIHAEVLFLETDEKELLRRFSETRRVHPLARERSVVEGIREERRLLGGLRDHAELVIDTTAKSVHELKKSIWDHYKHSSEEQTMQVHLESFGYRNGLPSEADIVLDVRFLPNPYFVAELKEKTGLDQEVRDFVMEKGEAVELVDRLQGLLEYLIPRYEDEGKRYLTVAIGCTGGRHRSVTVVEELGRRLGTEERPLRKVHRDVKK